MSVTTLAFSRRTALGGLAAASLATVSACQWGPPTTVAAPDAKADADAAGVKRLATAIAAQARLVADVVAAHAALAPALAGLTVLHDAHLAVLSDTPVDSAAVTVPPDPDGALTEVRRGEVALQRSLTEGAQSAASGPLARTLASMAAGISMHLVVVPTPPLTPVTPVQPEAGAA